jgi:hypothetical protein
MKKLLIASILLLTGCIGTDSVNDEIVNLSISVEQATLTNNAAATTIGGAYAFSASATNDRGTTYKPTATWNSSNTTVATIDEDGNLQAVAAGTTLITATVMSVQSEPVMISVAADNEVAALIEISGDASSISVDEQITLMARALNASGEEVPDTDISWQSEDESVASVAAGGEVTGLSSGATNIVANSGNITGTYPLSVGQATERSGTFEGVSGYNVEGTVVLDSGSGNAVSLELQDDFKSSRGPGIYIYLTNNGTSIEGGVEIGKLRSPTGADSYSIPGGIKLDQYDQVLIYCKPFGVPFGVADLDSDS